MDTTAKQMLLLTVDDVKKMREEIEKLKQQGAILPLVVDDVKRMREEMERLKRQVADLLINVFPMQQQIARMVERQNGLEAMWVSELSVRMEKEKEKEVEKTPGPRLVTMGKMYTVEVPAIVSAERFSSPGEAMDYARSLSSGRRLALGTRVVMTTQETFEVVRSE